MEIQISQDAKTFFLSMWDICLGSACETFGLSDQDICRPKGVGHLLRVQDILS
jgi:hypothetical protein